MVARVRRLLGLVRRACGLTVCAAVLVAGRAGGATGACPGDCNGDGIVTINEVIQGVTIALGQSPVSICPQIDQNGDGLVTVGELVVAVTALLDGCPPVPTATASRPTPTAQPSLTSSPAVTVTSTPTATATVNLPPVLPTASIYRTYPGFDIELPIGAIDPEGGALVCSAPDLPAGASFDPLTNLLSWTPASDQLGPFYVPFTCMDDAVPPAAADGQLTFAVSALDGCAIPSCDPASGCTTTLPPVSQTCCAGGPAARVAEPAAGCPQGLVLYVGNNLVGFGRLQNCDLLHVRNFAQSSAEVNFRIEARCLSTLNRVQVSAHMTSNAANHPVVFDTAQPPLFLDPTGSNGFATSNYLRFSVNNPTPYFDLEGAEANLTVTAKDFTGVSVSTQVRLLLTFTPVPDLPDVDPTSTPLPTCAAGVSPGPDQTPPCSLPTDTPTPSVSNG